VVSPYCFPLVFRLAPTHLGWDTQRQFTRRSRDPRGRNADTSDDNDDLTSLFANLTKDQKKKINELIETINEKDDLLECQEDLLIKENKKFVKLKNANALEVEKCENVSKELDICNDSISCLRTENASLNAKLEKLNV
jgi:hypothetical protein